MGELGEFSGTARFVVQRRLGIGGMGVVYEVLDTERNMRCALKTLKRMDGQALYRLKQEFRSLQDLQHPNLVSLGELIEERGEWFFTMELVQGTDLMSWVRPGVDAEQVGSAPTLATPSAPELAGTGAVDVELGGTLDEARLRAAMAQLALGLSALHHAGKVHRDVKPSNIRVTPDGRVVLLDFGLIADAVRGGSSSSSEAHVVGTAAYMAPEQAMAGTPRPESDWYAFGVVLYEALTGRLPYRGKTSFETLMKKQQEVATPPHVMVPDVPADLDSLCVRLLRIEPDDRPSAAEVCDALGAGGAEATAATAPIPSGETPFVGRGAELEALAGAFTDARRGNAVTVFVHGESGLGKSELFRRFSDRAATEHPGTVVLAGRCYERETVPYKAFDGIVDALSTHMLTLPPAAEASLVPPNAALLPRVFPVLGRVESIARAARPAQDVSDLHELRTRVFAALRALLARLAEQCPAVIVIDDLQWADAESLMLLEDLLRPPDAPRVLLLISSRAPPPDALSGDVRRLELGPLGAGEARELAERLAQSAGAAVRADAIVAEAAGHPMFIDELVRHSSAGGSGPAAPARLDEAIWSRVSDLDPSSIDLLRLVALAGAPLPQQIVCAAAGMEPSEFGKHLAVLRVASLVRGGGGRAADVVEPYHDRVREAVVSHLGDEHRLAAHERLARVLEGSAFATERPELVLRHLEAAGHAARAAGYALEGARRASAQLAFDRAAALYRAALRLGEHDADETRDLHVALGDALAQAGRGAESSVAYLSAADAADGALRRELQTKAAEQLLVTGHYEDGLEAIRSALAAVGLELAATPRRALVSMLWQRLLLGLRGLRWRQRAEADCPPDDLARLDVCQVVSDGLGMVDPFRGADFQVRGLRLALKLGEPGRVGRALGAEAMYAAAFGGRGIARGHRLVAETRRIAETTGDAYLLAGATGADGFVHYMEGKFRTAARRMEQSEAMLLDHISQFTWGLNNVRLFRIAALRSAGEIGELHQCFDGYVRDAKRRGDRYATTSMRRTGNVVWLARDRPDRARRDLEDTSWTPPQGQYHLQHFYDLIARTELLLYENAAPAAFSELAPEYRTLGRTLLMRIQIVRAFTRWLNARIALVNGDARRAGRIARKLEREGTGYARVFAAPTRAAVGRDPALWKRAVEVADAAGMAHVAAACRRRWGELAGGSAGTQLIEEADHWMTRQHIRDPGAFTRVFAPRLAGRPELVGHDDLSG